MIPNGREPPDVMGGSPPLYRASPGITSGGFSSRRIMFPGTSPSVSPH